MILRVRLHQRLLILISGHMGIHVDSLLQPLWRSFRSFIRLESATLLCRTKMSLQMKISSTVLMLGNCCLGFWKTYLQRSQRRCSPSSERASKRQLLTSKYRVSCPTRTTVGGQLETFTFQHLFQNVLFVQLAFAHWLHTGSLLFTCQFCLPT